MPVRMFAHARYGTGIGENRDMHMAVRTRRWTRADLERLPDDGNRYEVVRGELFVTPAPSPRHEELVYVLAGHLRRYLEPLGIGQVRQAPSALVVEGSEVQPDIMVRAQASPLPDTWDAMPIPLLVVEILSDATQRRDRLAKHTLYVDAGVAEYWIVDGDRRSVRVVRADADVVLAEQIEWRPAGAPVPLVLDIAAMFREALG